MLADGVVLVNNNLGELKVMLEDQQEMSARVGLTMYYSKTKIMRPGRDQQQVSRDGGPIHVYKYWTSY